MLRRNILPKLRTRIFPTRNRHPAKFSEVSVPWAWKRPAFGAQPRTNARPGRLHPAFSRTDIRLKDSFGKWKPRLRAVPLCTIAHGKNEARFNQERRARQVSGSSAEACMLSAWECTPQPSEKKRHGNRRIPVPNRCYLNTSMPRRCSSYILPYQRLMK